LLTGLQSGFSICMGREGRMKVENAGDLVYMTYFMFDWDKVQLRPSKVKCSECGGYLGISEQAVDSKGQRFDGYVCHTDKRLVWLKSV